MSSYQRVLRRASHHVRSALTRQTRTTRPHGVHRLRHAPLRSSLRL